MRMQHNLEQQIQARNQSGVTEEALREFSMMFKHFDKSSEEIESAFRALSKEFRPYVTAEELYANLTPEQAEYCIKRMKPYSDAMSGVVCWECFAP
uniref:EF-hand Ca insensitive domain-containing protein n=1 Tax=Parascaris equorum TaxID=6256 RepID=A0A914RV28_PAREQ